MIDVFIQAYLWSPFESLRNQSRLLISLSFPKAIFVRFCDELPRGLSFVMRGRDVTCVHPNAHFTKVPMNSMLIPCELPIALGSFLNKDLSKRLKSVDEVVGRTLTNTTD